MGLPTKKRKKKKVRPAKIILFLPLVFEALCWVGGKFRPACFGILGFPRGQVRFMGVCSG